MSRIILLAIICVVVGNAALAPVYTGGKNRIQGSYIVVLRDNTTDENLASFMTVLSKTHGVTFTFTYDAVFKGFAAKLTKAQLLTARSHPQVEFIEEDQTVHLNQGVCDDVQSDSDWGLTRVCKREMDLDGQYFFPSSGASSVDAYIIDTGIYGAHNDFSGRVIQGFKADNSWPNTDDHGHGTHVASTVGGISYGVAKGVTLIAVKVLSRSGTGSNAGVIAGVNYAAGNKPKRGRTSVGNMSLGGSISTALNRACNAASAAGVMMVVAAGNDNYDACQGSPSSAEDVITVGATDIGSNNDDVRSYFSNYGPCVHVFAPGSNILGAWIGSPAATRVISGTSMASPHVCGVSALVMDQNPTFTFDDLREHVTDDATFGKIALQCSNSVCNQSPNLLVFNGCE